MLSFSSEPGDYGIDRQKNSFKKAYTASELLNIIDITLEGRIQSLYLPLAKL
jgi:hypothetical protein